MTPLKKHAPLPEDANSATKTAFDYVKEQQEIQDVLTGVNISAIDSAETIDFDPVNPLADLATKVQEHLRQNVADNSMSSVPQEAYQTGGVTVTPSTDTKAYTGQLTPRDREDLIGRMKAGSATKADMANIDESMIMDLPMIVASDFSIPGQYDPKPKDPAIRFRWVNFVNWVQGNLQRFIALGFECATPDDVDQVRTPLADIMVQGTQIKQYDVVLMKVNVLKLMALYKRTVLSSLNKLDLVNSGKMGLATAQQTFMDDLSSDPASRGAYNKTRVATGREPVTFNHT
jgi:hypothetical protein